MKERTDAERLNWLESNRAELGAVVEDEWDVGSFPKLLRFYISVDYYKTRAMDGDEGEAGGFGNVAAEGATIREAIDNAIASESQ